MGICERCSTDGLLSRCTGCSTNANESLNAVIWSIASKTIFYHKDRLHYLVAKAIILQFNDRYVRSALVEHGPIEETIVIKRDKKRTNQFLTRSPHIEDRKNKKTQDIEEAKLKAKEGKTYEAGGFPANG